MNKLKEEKISHTQKNLIRYQNLTPFIFSYFCFIVSFVTCQHCFWYFLFFTTNNEHKRQSKTWQIKRWQKLYHKNSDLSTQAHTNTSSLRG